MSSLLNLFSERGRNDPIEPSRVANHVTCRFSLGWSKALGNEEIRRADGTMVLMRDLIYGDQIEN